MKTLITYLLAFFLCIGLEAQTQLPKPEKDIQTTFKKYLNGRPNRDQISTKELWPKIYNFNSLAGGKDVVETYDSGYLLMGLIVDSDMINRLSVLVKTDINGNILWTRYIGDPNYYGFFERIIPTVDGGCVLIGSTTVIDKCIDYFCNDVWIMKLNACGEKEWCKIYSVPMDLDYGTDVVQLSNGNYITLVNCFGYDIAEERIWLFCLSPSGETLWQKVYLTSEHPQWATNGYGYSLLKDDDENLLFTGECVEYDNYVNPTSWSFQLLHIKFSSDGEEIWGKPWYMNYDSTKYGGRVSAQDFHGNYSTGGGHGTGWIGCNCHPPVLFRQTKDGVHFPEIRYTQGLPAYIGQGAITGMDYLEANKIALATTYLDEPGVFIPAHTVARISDTLGNILKERHLYDDLNEILGFSLTTDKSILMTSGFWVTQDSLKMFLYKLTSDLEYAPIDSRPLVYDYLCSGSPQLMDTIYPDCDIIVGMEEPMQQKERYSIQVTPNPSTDKLTLTLPDRMLKEWQSNSLSSKTLYFSLPENLQLQIVDVLGRTILTKAISKEIKQVTFDVSPWPAGVYLARLTAGNSVVAEAKVVKQ